LSCTKLRPVSASLITNLSRFIKDEMARYMRVLITGINGFAASHLADEYLREGDDEVQGTVRQHSNLSNIAHILNKIKTHYCDVTDAYAVLNVVRDGDFDVIHHLAGVTYLPFSYDNPSLTLNVNFMGTLNVLEAIRRSDSDCVLHYTSSSEVYGALDDTKELMSEETRLNPMSPYATAKIASENLCRNHQLLYGAKSVITRAFNHTSERQAKHFFVRTVVDKGFEIKSGATNSFALGNLMTFREYLDARDVAEAYKLAISKPLKYGEPYNIASGTGYAGLFIVKLVSRMLGIQNYDIVQSNPRRVDSPFVIGDGRKFSQATGWSRRTYIAETLESMIRAVDPALHPNARGMDDFFDENRSLIVQR